MLDDVHGGSVHVHDVDLGMARDTEVWEYPREHGLMIRLLRGHPPKVVWIRRGNCSTQQVAELLRRNATVCAGFGDDPTAALLVIA